MKTIYFMQAGDAIKIGVTDGVKDRLKVIQSCCPLKVELIHTIEGNAKLEAEIHYELKEHHLHHEWYEAEPVLEYIRLHKHGANSLELNPLYNVY